MSDKPTHGRYKWDNAMADPNAALDYARLLVTIKFPDGNAADFNYFVPSFNGKESERDIMIKGFEEAVKKFYYEQWGI